MSLRFQVPVRAASVARVTAERPAGRSGAARSGGADIRVLELTGTAEAKQVVTITWGGAVQPRPPEPAPAPPRPLRRTDDRLDGEVAGIDPLGAVRPRRAVQRPGDGDFSATGKYVSPRSPFCSLALPSQGIGGGPGTSTKWRRSMTRGLRSVAGANGGRLVLPNGVPFATPSAPGDAKTSSSPRNGTTTRARSTVPLTGKAAHAFLLMAGSTNRMQSRLDNGEVVVTYADGSTARLALHNPRQLVAH